LQGAARLQEGRAALQGGGLQGRAHHHPARHRPRVHQPGQPRPHPADAQGGLPEARRAGDGLGHGRLRRPRRSRRPRAAGTSSSPAPPCWARPTRANNWIGMGCEKANVGWPCNAEFEESASPGAWPGRSRTARRSRSTCRSASMPRCP
ncbi:Uncharacterized protein APZ42_006743, partial [Daphnia magna]